MITTLIGGILVLGCILRVGVLSSGFVDLWGPATGEIDEALVMARKKAEGCMLYPHPEIFGPHKDFVGDYMSIVQHFLGSSPVSFLPLSPPLSSLSLPFLLHFTKL